MKSEENELERLQQLVAEVTGLAPAATNVAIRPPLLSQSNRLYEAWAGERHLIVKVYLKPEEFHDAPVREFKALQLLAPLDVAPQPLFYQPPSALAGPLVIYDYMPGQMWDRDRPTAADLSRLAGLWLRLNEITSDQLWRSRAPRTPSQAVANFQRRFERYAAWVEAEFRPGRQASDLCQALLENSQNVAAQLAGYSPALYFCRSDPRFANVIRRPDGRLGLVDWEDCGLRDPAQELADLLTHPNQEDLLTWSEWQTFIQPYTEVRTKTDPELLDRLQLYLALFPVFWLSLLLERGIERTRAGSISRWSIEGLPANQKLRRYLARASAWPALGFAEALEKLERVHFFPESSV
jgi:Ser/Thr protein kinase RdoA (MazF antagonist)